MILDLSDGSQKSVSIVFHLLEATLELDATGFQVIVRCLLHLLDPLVQGVVVVILIPIGFIESILQSLDDCLLGFDHSLHLLVFDMKDCRSVAPMNQSRLS